MSDNKRIAKNTIIVYLRLFFVTIIGLLTSRYALKALGVSDYGLYNVVGGVISLFAVVSGSLSSTTIRFLNIEIGKPEGDANRIFNVCNVIHIAFALLLLILAESIGVYYIYNYLNVEAGKESDAMFVFQVSTIVACVGLINIPYMSVLVAKEKFLLIMLIDVTNSLIKLCSVVGLLYYNGNILRTYALLMSITTAFSFVMYHGISYKKWRDIIKWRLVYAKESYKAVLVYNNYNVLATISLIVRSQGSNMLINFFFGTIVNGAYAIARTVQGFVEAFMANFDVAAAPRITQQVGANNEDTAQKIVFSISRYCVLMMILVFFPLFVETEFVLSLWLGQVPEHATMFCRILLVVVLVASTGGGMIQYINASGKIKWFKIQSCFWSVIVLPIGYVLFKIGFEAWWIFCVFIVSDIFNRICQLYLMRKLLGFNSGQFVVSAYIRPMIICTIMIAYIILYNHICIVDASWRLLGIMMTGLVTAIVIWAVGLKGQERNFIISKVFHRA